MSRWTIFQFFTLGFLIMVMSLVELFSGTIVSLFGLTEFPLLPVTFILLVIICFYLLFLFENKKENHIFSSSLWVKMPMLTGVLGAISATLFIVGVEFFPLFDWVQEWRVFLYFFIGYFLLLCFLFVFSIIHKYQKNSRSETNIHQTLFFLVILVIAFFFLLG